MLQKGLKRENQKMAGNAQISIQIGLSENEEDKCMSQLKHILAKEEKKCFHRTVKLLCPKSIPILSLFSITVLGNKDQMILELFSKEID